MRKIANKSLSTTNTTYKILMIAIQEMFVYVFTTRHYRYPWCVCLCALNMLKMFQTVLNLNNFRLSPQIPSSIVVFYFLLLL